MNIDQVFGWGILAILVVSLLFGGFLMIWDVINTPLFDKCLDNCKPYKSTEDYSEQWRTCYRFCMDVLKNEN